MDNEFGSEFIVITDEEGVDYELEILSSVLYNGSLYYALAPAEADDGEELEVSILKATDVNGEELLSTVDDEDELETVYAMLIEQLYEDDENDEDDEDDEEAEEE